MAKISNISAQTKEAIQRKSAYILPNNPTEAGFKAPDIRNTLFKPILDATNSALAELDRVINEINEVLDIAVDKIQTVIEGVYTGAEFTYYKSGNNFVITGYIGTETRITFPFEVIYEGQRYPVTTINALGVTPLKEVTIPYEITTIGTNAFKDSTLDSVRLARLYTLPTGAFKLSSITKYHVPAEHSTEYRTSLASYITSQLQVVSYDTIKHNKDRIAYLYEKIPTDISNHDVSELAHEYIRTLISTVQTNLDNHNTSEEAHAYIRGLITAAQNAVQGNLDTHKASSTDHSDIRQSVTDLGTAQTNALNTHNTSLTSHANLLSRLSAVEAVASGKASVWIFENSSDLFDYLADTGTARADYGYDSTEWKSGDRILVVGGLEYEENAGEQVLTGLGAEYWYREDFDPDQRFDAFGNDLRLFEPMEDTYIGYLEPNNTSDLLQILDLSLQASASAELAEGYAQDALISAQTSREYAEGKDLNGVPVPSLAENNAKYFKEQAQATAKTLEKELAYTKSEINRLSSDVIEVAGEVKKYYGMSGLAYNTLPQDVKGQYASGYRIYGTTRTSISEGVYSISGRIITRLKCGDSAIYIPKRELYDIDHTNISKQQDEIVNGVYTQKVGRIVLQEADFDTMSSGMVLIKKKADDLKYNNYTEGAYDDYFIHYAHSASDYEPFMTEDYDSIRFAIHTWGSYATIEEAKADLIGKVVLYKLHEDYFKVESNIDYGVLEIAPEAQVIADRGTKTTSVYGDNGILLGEDIAYNERIFIINSDGSETDVPVADAVETTIGDSVYLTHALLEQGDTVCLIGTTAEYEPYDDFDIEYVYGTALAEHKEAVNPHNITPETIGLGTAKEDIATVKKDIKDLSQTIQQSNLSGEDKISTEGYGTLSLPKNATGYCGVELNGNTLSTLVAQSGVAVSGTVTFNSVLNSKYYDQLHKTILTGTGSQMTITNDTATVANIAVFDLTAHGLDTLTVEQCDLMTDLYFNGTQSAMVSRVSSVGKNLFDRNNVSLVQITSDGLMRYGWLLKNLSAGTYTLKSYGITLQRPITYKIISNGVYGNYVNVQSGIPLTLTINSEDYLIIYMYQDIMSLNNDEYLQLEKGSTPTPYEPYRKQEQYIKPYPLYRLPNGTCDTIVNGVYNKRVKKYVVVEADVVGEIYTEYLDYDIVTLAKPTDYLYYNSTSSSVDTMFLDTGNYIYNDWSPTGFGVRIAKGTTLEQAKTALIGKALYYQLNPLNYIVDNNIATGLLNANPNGTIYFDNGFADAGIYNDGITILNQDYPIVTLEKLLKLNADGSHTDLDVSTATIALDRKSFTHAGLTNGDIVAFTYKGADSPLKGKNKITYLDSKNVIGDTTNGKFYKYKPVVTNGVIASWELEEV